MAYTGQPDIRTTLGESRRFEQDIIKQLKNAHNHQAEKEFKPKIKKLQEAIQKIDTQAIPTLAADIKAILHRHRVTITSDSNFQWLGKMEYLLEGEKPYWEQTVKCPGAAAPAQGGDHYSDASVGGGGMRQHGGNKPALNLSVQSIGQQGQGSGNSSRVGPAPGQAARTGAPSSSREASYESSGNSSRVGPAPGQAARTGAPSSSREASYVRNSRKISSPSPSSFSHLEHWDPNQPLCSVLAQPRSTSQTQGTKGTTIPITYPGLQDFNQARPSARGPDVDTDRESLKQQLQQQDPENNLLMEDLRIMLEENIQLKKDLEQKKEDIIMMDKRYNETRQSMQLATKEAEELRVTNGNLNGEITKLEEDVQKNNAKFTEHWNKAQDDIKRYKHDLKDRDNELRDRDSQIISLKTERGDLSTRYASLNVAAKGRTSLSTGSDALEKTITGSDSFPETQESQQQQKDIDKLKKELAKEQKTRSVAENHYKQSLEDIHKRLTEKSMECETAQSEIEGYKRVIHKMKSAMSESDAIAK